jgi:hypothetical protein
MGVWDIGNFDNDAALDYADALFDDLIKTIVCGLSNEAFLRNHLEALAALDMLTIFAERLDAPFAFGPETVIEWREKYMALATLAGETNLQEHRTYFDRFEVYMRTHQYRD